MTETFHAGPNLGQLSDVTIIHGDCIEAMRELADDSVDAIVTDPPYGLGFMGKEWDALPPGLPWAQECLRVLKPGGHLLAFGGTRTWHRLAVAVEDAGFEIRDSIAWLYGSGFPKSLDVSKAIDKAAGATREVVSERFRAATGRAEQGTGGYAFGEAFTETAPATPEAEQWQGFGTAMKPSHEPIVVARKPFRGTVAQNVLAHGTGALNIDGCRIGTTDSLGGGANKAMTVETRHEGWGRPWMQDDTARDAAAARSANNTAKAEALGRWPANVILDGRTEPVLRLRYNLPVEVERTIRESFGASTGHLPAVRDFDCCATEPRGASEVLLAPVPSSVDVGEPDGRARAALGQATHSGDAGEDLGNEAGQSANGREVPRMEGRAVSEPGLHVRETERAANARAGVVSLDVDPQRWDVYPGTSASDRSPVGSGVDAGRACASHQRAEGGQPTGELGISPVEQLASDEARRGGRGDIQAAQGERSASVTPLEILHSQCPPRWRQHFVVVGESQSQAAALDEQSGTSTSKRAARGAGKGESATYGVWGMAEDDTRGHDDSGGASRFFKVVSSTMETWEQPGERSTRVESMSAGKSRASTDSDSRTDGSGSRLTDLSPLDSTSTIETTTHSTTTSPTCSCSRPANTRTITDETAKTTSTLTESSTDAVSAALSTDHCKSSQCARPGLDRDTASHVSASTCESGESETASTPTNTCAPIDSEMLTRFRYNAKAPKKERPTYVDADGKQQSHATVKPLALMRWLVRLVTPPGGVVLDPFAGSGTTVEAALLEDFRVIGIEREADYLPMIQQRIARCLNS